MKKWVLSLAVILFALSSEVFAQSRPRENTHVIEACREAFSYDFQRRECVEKARSADQVRGCSLFSYDFQKFDCLEESKALGGGVAACHEAFAYDFQRFDCMRLRVTGRTVKHCATAYSYDFQKFDCLKKNEM